MTDSPEQETAPRARTSRRRARLIPPARWWVLPFWVLTGVLAGGAYGVFVPRQYAATSYAIAVPTKDAQPGAALGFAQAYGRIATSDSTIAYARVAAGMPARKLRKQVQTETSPDSPMIAITGTSRRPSEAADIANAVADALFVSSNQVAKSTGVRLLSFSQAIPPAQSVSPTPLVAGAVGGSTGGLIGGLVLLVRPRRRPEADTATREQTGPQITTTVVPAPAGSAASEQRKRV
ncbi:lipopolysaccharide biosynthesis protein [Streptomyces albipurpureus]|uniref:Lipopolysaccharide biosynthesis protein n=1 Tax=Streptomyces albipurpureus TaxID=2897419 RepID=A0ABT0UL62_9ACTN|nr:lipopolysaccharide biosynthesis protein [Streptomyces sp. CWNU-1]MCM2389205.1 lipopolysaccharide biosynthesis protein [Streptomyces sp. CWNU-1]